MRRLVLLSLLIATLTSAGERDVLVKAFLAHLKNAGVAVTVIRQTDDTLELGAPGDERMQLALENLEANVAQAEAMGLSAKDARQRVFDKYAAVLKAKAASMAPLRLESDGKRIRPRLVPPGYLTQMAGTLREPLASTGVELGYVLDSPESVRFLTARDLVDLGLDKASLHKLAMQNLAPTLALDEVRKVLAGNGMLVIKGMDSFDAARLLLVPAALKRGEALAAAIPDRDTLVLAPVPPDGNWDRIRDFAAKISNGPKLLDRPLKVTADGFEAP